jgi:hypothetical protein
MAGQRLEASFAQEELLAQRLLLEELGEEKMRFLAQELAKQDLTRSLLVEEGVEWSGSEEEEYLSGSEEEESVDEEGEFEPEPEFDPWGTK